MKSVSAVLTVETVMQEMRRRIRNRLSLIRGHTEEELLFWMERLRELMFRRRLEGEAFHPLTQEELAVLEHTIRGYVQDGRLMAGNGDLLPKYYEIIRHNHLCGDNAVEPEMFRLASAAITKALLADGIKAFSIDPANAIVLLPWRAGLAFADAAFYAGFREFYHWGARRNERTLETETYFEEAPLSLAVHPEKQTVIIADPMLATGNTMISATRLLGNYGVPQERIFVLSVISAPEGVDHVLRACPRVRILVGRHDEYLNSRGYIEPGLGDFGDLFFEGLERVAVWRRRGILSDDAARVLIARMTA